MLLIILADLSPETARAFFWFAIIAGILSYIIDEASK